MFLTVLINPNSDTRVLASSTHYAVLKSTIIKALKVLPPHITIVMETDHQFTIVRVEKENLMAKMAYGYKDRSMMG